MSQGSKVFNCDTIAVGQSRISITPSDVNLSSLLYPIVVFTHAGFKPTFVIHVHVFTDLGRFAKPEVDPLAYIQ